MFFGFVIAQFVLDQKGKANGGQIGVTGVCPITVTLIRHLFLFRGESPGETSPLTWGFEKAKVEVSRKVILSHKLHRLESPKGLTIWSNDMLKCTCVEQDNKKTLLCKYN